MSVNEGAGSATPTRDTQKNADIVRRQAISDLTVLARQFEDASKRWPNLTSVLVTWSESAPAFDAEWLPDDLQPQYAVPVPAPAGELHYVALAIGDCRLDSPARRFRPGSAGMLILRRSFGVMGDRADIRDPSEAVAVADRWHALTDQLMPVWYETSKVDPSPEGDRLWNPRWRLILHGEVESRHLVVRSVYQVSVVNDLFLASSILIHRRINKQKGSEEPGSRRQRWREPKEPTRPATPVAAGVKWKDAMESAERHVKRNNGVFPGRNTLAHDIVGCARSTMTKAIRRSPYLKARQAEAKAQRSTRAKTLSKTALESVPAPERDDDELARLVAEQKADDARDHRQAKARQMKRSR